MFNISIKTFYLFHKEYLIFLKLIMRKHHLLTNLAVILYCCLKVNIMLKD